MHLMQYWEHLGTFGNGLGSEWETFENIWERLGTLDGVWGTVGNLERAKISTEK
jgi:hypothetical protein